MPTPRQYMAVRAPSFDSDPNVDTFISFAELETGTSYCSDDHRNKAVFLLAAHWMALKARNAAGGGPASPGAIAGEKEGQLSRSYKSTVGVDSGTNPDLPQTSWGVELLTLQQGCFILPRTRHQ